jgi:asparagine synthase (glutamine-hydrolysing)
MAKLQYLELQSECRAAGWSFRTTSDTEVLIARWALGKGALTRLIGMFASY